MQFRLKQIILNAMSIKKILNLLVVVMLLLTFPNCKTKDSKVIVTALTCENQINPAGIDIVNPSLSWIIESKSRGEKQTAFQVLVATSLDLLNKDQGDLWNSEKQKSDQSILIPYKGKPLVSGMQCYWKVRVWNKDELASNWSQPARWSMGLLESSDWKAEWIGIEKTFANEDDTGQYRKLAARYLRKEFDITKKIRSATAYISGLGLYELYINGSKTGNMVLAPGATQYNKTVFYNTFDIASQLISGKNAIGVIVGNGRYFSMRKNDPFVMQNFGFPKLLFQLNIEYTDGSKDEIVSNASWKLTANGPIKENNEFDGEKYDARLEITGWDKPGFDDSKWIDAQLVVKPAGKLVAQLNEPIRVTGHIKPVSVKQLNPDVFIFDMGQNMVGWASLTVKGKKGDKITMRFSEILKEDGSLYLANLRSAKATDSYILKGSGVEVWEPRFTYHGFRYVELTGMKTTPDLSAITGCIVNDDLANSGSFECSNQVINQVYKNATWGIRGNYRSFPTDCPQRDERMGWLGDRAAGCRGESYIFNNGGLYRKWLGDIRDAQTAEGSIPDVCPAYWALYNDNVTWDGSGIRITEMLLDQFGNTVVLAENYEAMKKWLLYMYNKYAIDGTMPRDTYGDWCMPPEEITMIHSKDPARITEGTLLGTSFFYNDARIMQRFAKMLSKPGDEKQFERIAIEMKTGYNKRFFKPSHNYYSNNTPTANVLSLAFGLVPEDRKQAVFNNLIEKIETDFNGHIPVGLVGISYLQRVLTDFGRADIALRFASETDYPSWGYMLKNNATTIWELWNGNTADPAMNSGNHVMLLGDLIIWMHENIGGIKPAEPGFKSIIMKPLINEEIKFANASHRSPYGNIVSNWKFNKSNDFVWDITIPVNTTAKVYIPANNENSVSENNRKASTAEGVTFREMKDGYAVFVVLSGVYQFVSREVKIEKNDFDVSQRVSILPNDTSSGSRIRIVMNCSDKDAEIRYTLDGSTPTETSVLYKIPFEIPVSAVVKARSFKKSVNPGFVTRRSYDIYNIKTNGLNFEYFEGKWEKIPDFNKMKPVRKGKVNGFGLHRIKSKEDYWGVRFSGYIEIPLDGIYSFSTISDDGSRLFVNNQKIIDNDGVHGPFTVQGNIELKKGKYQIMLDYFEGNYGELLRVEVDGPGIQKQSLPVSMLFFN